MLAPVPGIPEYMNEVEPPMDRTHAWPTRWPGRRAVPRRGTVAAAALVLVAVGACTLASTAQATSRNFFAVQLKWYDQAQFAGFYAAEHEGYFAASRLNVHLLAGSATIDPLQELAAQRADVAVASQRQAELARANGIDTVNVAQMFQSNYMVILCQRHRGLESPADLTTATFAVSGPEFESDVREYLAAAAPAGSNPVFVRQLPDIESLTSGEADCMLGSTFNEYWRALDAGFPLLVVDPQDVGVDLVQDGLYVLRERLHDPSFRSELARLLLAVRSGWQYTAGNQESAVRLVLQRNPDLSYEVQTRQLETVLTLIDLQGTDFGYYDLSKYARINSAGIPAMDGNLAPHLWTHEVYASMLRETDKHGLLTPSVKFYLNSLRATQWYHWLIYLGTVAAAVAGSVMGARRGYRFWGCFVLALVSAIGGGVLRDIVIGGSRYPVWLTQHPEEIYLAFAGAFVTEGIRRRRGQSRTLAMADAIAARADVVGFSILAIHGASVAMSADLPAIWAPLAAALTVAGGGILSDILVADEHVEFRTVPYEEQALAGSLVLVAGLWLANHFEHRPEVVVVTFAVTLLMLLTGRYTSLRTAIVASRSRTQSSHIPA